MPSKIRRWHLFGSLCSIDTLKMTIMAESALRKSRVPLGPVQVVWGQNEFEILFFWHFDMGVAGIFNFFSQKAGQERAPSLPGTGLCRIVYLACFAKIAKKFENRRKSASVGPTRERARRTPIFVDFQNFRDFSPIFVDFQIFSRFLQNMPNTLSYTVPSTRVRREGEVRFLDAVPTLIFTRSN